MNIEGLRLETHVSANTTIDKVKHVSNVTISWEGITIDQLQALAQRSIVIRKQNEDRLAGIVPESSYTIVASEYAIGARRKAPTKSVEKQIEDLSPEELARLQALISAKLGV